MKTSLPILIVAAALALPAVSAAQEGKFAVVDVQDALLRVPDGKKAKANLERQAKKKKQELEAQKSKLEKMQNDLQKQINLLQDSVKRQKVAEFEQARFALQKAAMDAERELKSKEVKLLEPISKKLEKTIGEIAKEKGFILVFHKAGVAYNVPAIDITDLVVKRYK